MKINTEYNFGDIVFLITDQDQLPRIVTGIFITPLGVTYGLNYADSQSEHFPLEFTKERQVF
jgi:hypothetical protein